MCLPWGYMIFNFLEKPHKNLKCNVAILYLLAHQTNFVNVQFSFIWPSR